MMTCERRGALELGSLHPEEFDAWCAFCGRIFPPDAEYFRGHFQNDPAARIEDIFVARAGEEIVSSVRLFTRSAWVNGRIARVGGIGEVCSDPAIRGQGVSSHLLERAMETMDARGWELGMLYTGRYSHYARHGFARTQRKLKRLQAEQLSALGGGYEVRAFERRDLNAVMGIYDLYTSQFDLALRREARAYWEKWVLASWVNPMVLTQEGRVIAYADTQRRDGVLHVREAGAIPGEDAVLAMLLGVCASKQDCAAVQLSAMVLPALKGEEMEPSGGLMVRMARPALGFADCAQLLEKTAPRLLQWDTDGF